MSSAPRRSASPGRPEVATLLLTHEGCLEHEMGPGHPERPQRLEAVLEELESVQLPGLVHSRPARAPVEAVEANHSPEHVEFIRRASGSGRLLAATPDTAIGPSTFDAALLASGAGLAAVDAVLSGAAANAFCLHRPPGHHAERDQAMGFCFFNHVAVAARHLRARHGVERVGIVDWDVHHGNGTQNSFYEDGSVFYFSVHQQNHYPFTGHVEETGAGEGEGTTLNAPLPAGAGDRGYRRIFRERLRPALERFEPGFLLLSAGFDAHASDPLGGMLMTREGFAGLTEECVSLARDLCQGRLVSLLEGGYDLEATATSVVAHLQVLCG